MCYDRKSGCRPESYQCRLGADDWSQRWISAVPCPTLAGIQTILDHRAKTRPDAKNLKPGDFIDGSFLKDIEDSGFVKKLYAY